MWRRRNKRQLTNTTSSKTYHDVKTEREYSRWCRHWRWHLYVPNLAGRIANRGRKMSAADPSFLATWWLLAVGVKCWQRCRDPLGNKLMMRWKLYTIANKRRDANNNTMGFIFVTEWYVRFRAHRFFCCKSITNETSLIKLENNNKGNLNLIIIAILQCVTCTYL